MFILIHIRPCEWMSDKKSFTWPISGKKTTLKSKKFFREIIIVLLFFRQKVGFLKHVPKFFFSFQKIDFLVEKYKKFFLWLGNCFLPQIKLYSVRSCMKSKINSAYDLKCR